ncbi:TPA: ASCH domain-containing protein [Vibrio vulnificus]|nr:ASCH domain-containing protein [Vibrio vulnificus]HDY8080473.1 ASCH domain-containing protein [Vibrio vulnificus]HDY8191263.1 ASCH domain-containing protein [Vibrio vulnificus]
MKVVPMIFNTEMVKALLDGRKTVTRRPAKNLSFSERVGFIVGEWAYGLGWNFRETMNNCIRSKSAKCPAQIGDLIYVRETFTTDPDVDHDSWNDHELSYVEWVGCEMSSQFLPEALKANKHCLYKADCKIDMKWTPSIHMPRWASRLTLKVTDVRIERVQDISEEEAIKEGINKHHQLPAFKSPIGYHTSPAYAYEELWNSIYGNWDENPYVWVIEFEVIHQNVDEHIESVKDAE